LATGTARFTHRDVAGAAKTITRMSAPSTKLLAIKASPRRWRSLAMRARRHSLGPQKRHFSELQQATTMATVTATRMPEIVKPSNANIANLLNECPEGKACPLAPPAGETSALELKGRT
jgi:hypothetical protein